MKNDTIKTAWVLSGGREKGLIQHGVLKALWDNGIKPGPNDLVMGISVGAANGAAWACHAIDDSHKAWMKITNRDVYKGKIGFWSALKMVVRNKKGIVDGIPYLELIEKILGGHKFKCKYACGTVDYLKPEMLYHYTDKGWYETIFSSEDIFNSGTMPLIWGPIKYAPRLEYDGGVIDNCPLGEAIRWNPKNIVIINCQDRKLRPVENLNGYKDVAKRTMEISMHNTLVNDINQFERINAFAKNYGTNPDKVIFDDEGNSYRYFKKVIIEPTKTHAEFLDFHDKRNYAYGYDLGLEHIDHIKALLK